MSESGVSLAVAPGTGETDTETNPNVRESSNNDMKDMISNTRRRRTGTGIMGSLRVIELQLVAFIMVFSLSGLVPLLDLFFPAITSTYILALSWLAFPPTPGASSGIPTPSSEPDLFQGEIGVLMGMYVAVGTTVGLLLPLAYVLGGFARGDQQAVRSATPHLFLLSFQILTENIMSGFSSWFSPPIRAMVPLLYTARRIFVLLHWTRDVWLSNNQLFDIVTSIINIIKPRSMVDQSDSTPKFDYVTFIKLDKDEAWFWFGRCLAVANLAYFSTNLLCFLIPYYLPRAFRTYFNQIREHNHELQSKIIHDHNRVSSSSSSRVQVKNKKDD